MQGNDQEKSVKAQRAKNYQKSFPGQSREEIAHLYDTWATYEEKRRPDATIFPWLGLGGNSISPGRTHKQTAASPCISLSPKTIILRDQEALEHRGRYITRDALRRAGVSDVASIRVLDVAAGTGMLAETLWKDGYRQIDALDGSRGMLEKARLKNVYQGYFCNFMEESEGVIDDDTYDVVATLGSIGHGHLETESLRQMFRVTKPGGLICICGVKQCWDGNPEYHQRMRGIIAELEKNNKISILEDRTVENYYYFKQWDNGILIVLKKL